MSGEAAQGLHREPLVLLESFDPARGGRSFLFERPVEVIRASEPKEIGTALDRLESAIGQGLHVAGYVAYEAASGLDVAMETHKPGPLPPLWFGVFERRLEVAPGNLLREGECRVSDWQPSIDRPGYDEAIAEIQRLITAGDTYQVNYTFRLRASWEGDAFALYRRLCQSQRAAYCAYLQWDRHRILSVSPELFFELSGGILKTRPMKGTCARGRWAEEDEKFSQQLRHSPKERGENLMIVDLLRNDLGRISAAGSVHVEKLFEVERYETVLQMTSTIRSQVDPKASLKDLFTALFPCGSVTGAPKIRTMHIISRLEDSPRGVYTGCIGYISPGPEAVFNVAIRTLWLDEAEGVAECGVGGGITHDSTAEGEYEECLTKAGFLTERRPEFELLETLLWEEGSYFLLERHLRRLRDSARYFGFDYHEEHVLQALARLHRQLGPRRHRVRILLSRDGFLRCEQKVLPEDDATGVFRVGLAQEPVNSRDVFLYHKTTNRAVYESRARSRRELNDVILVNERGEITEATIANVAVELEGVRWTPPMECGLLPGVYRAELLEKGVLREKILRPEDLRRAEAVYLLNSVRRLWRVKF